ncbi:MAG: helix-turn-helix transcriptional regulator [Chloroflexota bacterium]
MERLATYLRQQRQLCRYDVRTLVSKSGVTNAQISRIENGKSQITVEALVRLSFGLGIRLEDVLLELQKGGIFQDASCLNYLMIRNTEIPSRDFIPTAMDICTFIQLFRERPQEVEANLIDGLLEIYRNPNPPGSDEMVEIQIDHAIHGSTAIPYPPQPYLLDTIYAAGGVITIQDVTQSIRYARLQDGKSLRSHANERISFSTIARIEKGAADRLLLSQILELDSIFERQGSWLAHAWEAEEYETGIAISKAVSNWNWLDGWEHTEKAAVDTLISICRWHQAQGIDHRWGQTLKQVLENFQV